MTDDFSANPPPPESEANPPPEANPAADPSLEALRDILFSRYRQRIGEMEEELDALEGRLTDRDTLIAIIAPVLGQAIRQQIRDAREEMIETLYPIIGQTVVRAVSEAIKDLARTIDSQMHTTFSPRVVGRRLKARITGVSDPEIMLRDSLPFEVEEVFLIHRENGLLLWHISRDGEADEDSDLISGMLTAIRDFAQETFGKEEEGQLEQIQYGDRRILIESGKYAYLAVVVDGIEPAGFRAEIRERVVGVNLAHEKTLQDYDGNPEPLSPVESPLKSLITQTAPTQMTPAQKWMIGGVMATLVVCTAATCLLGNWVWQVTRPTPTPVPVIAAATATPSPTPTHTRTPSPTATPQPTATPSPAPTHTLTPSPTATPTPSPTHTATVTPRPTATPVMGVMTGNVWLREGPSSESPRLGMVLERGQPVEILAVTGPWQRIRWAPSGQAEVIGWVPGQWVGTLEAIPEQIITPQP